METISENGFLIYRLCFINNEIIDAIITDKINNPNISNKSTFSLGTNVWFFRLNLDEWISEENINQKIKLLFYQYKNTSEIITLNASDLFEKLTCI